MTHSPYFRKMYKLSPLFSLNLRVLCLIYVFLLPPYFVQDALRVLDAPAQRSNKGHFNSSITWSQSSTLITFLVSPQNSSIVLADDTRRRRRRCLPKERPTYLLPISVKLGVGRVPL